MSFYHSLYVWITFGFLIFLYLIFSNSPAPYGRHFSKQWGPSLNNNWGWFWMELPALVVMPMIVLISPVEKNEIIICTDSGRPVFTCLDLLFYFSLPLPFPSAIQFPVRSSFTLLASSCLPPCNSLRAYSHSSHPCVLVFYGCW